MARFQAKTPEDSAFATVFLVEEGGVCEILRWVWDRDSCALDGGKDLLAFTVVVLVGGEHYVGRVEGEVVELGVAWSRLDEAFRCCSWVSLLIPSAFVFRIEMIVQRTEQDCRRQSLGYEC